MDTSNRDASIADETRSPSPREVTEDTVCAQSNWEITGTSEEVYHSCFVPTIIRPWTSRTLTLAKPQPGERILDVACGSGDVTRRAAELVGPTGHVVGLDINPAMLAVARRQDGGNRAAAIEWREGSADALPLESRSIDVVVCQFGMMFFTDRLAALKEMRRVLTDGGRIVLVTWGPLDKCLGNAAMARAWGKHFGREQAAKFQVPHSLDDPKEIRRLMRDAGFGKVRARIEAGWAHFASVQALACSYGALSGLETDTLTRDAIIADVTQSLKAYCHTDELRYPVEVVLASVLGVEKNHR